MNNKMKALALGVSAAVIASGSALAATTSATGVNGLVNLGNPGAGAANKVVLDLTDFTAAVSTTSTGAVGAVTFGTSNGNVCNAVGWTCSTVATDLGFSQRTITNGTQNYVQQAVISAGGASTFDAASMADGSIVRMNNDSGQAAGSNNGFASSSSVKGFDAVNGNQVMSQNVSLRKDHFWTSTDQADGTATLVFNQMVNENDGNIGTNSTLFFAAFQFQEVASDMGAAASDAYKILRVAQLAGDAVDSTLKQEFRMARINSSLAAGSLANTVAPYTYYTNNGATAALVVNGSTITADSTAGELEILWLGQNFGSGAIGMQIIAGPVNGSTVLTAGGAVKTAAGAGIQIQAFGRTGFTGTVAQSGFDWNNGASGGQSASNAVYFPKF